MPRGRAALSLRASRELPTTLAPVKQPRRRFTPAAKALRSFGRRHGARLACSATARWSPSHVFLQVVEADVFGTAAVGVRTPPPRGPAAGKRGWARPRKQPGHLRADSRGNRPGLGGRKLLRGDVGEGERGVGETHPKRFLRSRSSGCIFWPRKLAASWWRQRRGTDPRRQVQKEGRVPSEGPCTAVKLAFSM